MSKRFVGSVAVVLGGLFALSWSGSASAQEWLRDRRYQYGPGYRAGELELHPGLAGEIGYDSNYFLRSDKSGPNIVNGAPTSPPEGAAILRITPSLAISTGSSPQRVQGGEAPAEPPKVQLNAGLAATYREFFGNEELRKQRNVSGTANFTLGILPGRPWGANIFANYDRTIQPTVFGNPDLSFNRDDIGAGAEVVAQPNSGTLDWHLGYMFHTTLFEQSEGKPFDNAVHSIFTRGRWKFRPRTAVLYDGSAAFRSYSNTQGSLTAIHDSTPVRARLGLNGLVTPRFALLAMAGWAATFFNTTNGRDKTVQQYDTVIGQVEAKFFPTANPSVDDPQAASLVLSSIAVGFARDYQSSYLSDFYGSDRGYLKVNYFFAGRALVALEGGVGTVEYPTVYAYGTPLGTTPQPLHSDFTDIRADATLFAEYRFIDSVGVNTTLRYTENFSNTQLRYSGIGPGTGAGATTAAGPNSVYDMSWRRFEAYIGLRWFM